LWTTFPFVSVEEGVKSGELRERERERERERKSLLEMNQWTFAIEEMDGTSSVCEENKVYTDRYGEYMGKDRVEPIQSKRVLYALERERTFYTFGLGWGCTKGCTKSYNVFVCI